DVAVGPILHRRARAAGVVYTVADGDQPGCIMRLVDWARALGLEVVVAGRGTRRFGFDRAGDPSEAFARYGYDPKLVQEQQLNAQGLGFYGLKIGPDGTTAAHYRPYHLCGIEAPMSIAEAGLYGKPTGAPIGAPVADVIAVAKRDLRAGETLDGSGGRMVYGLIDRAE